MSARNPANRRYYSTQVALRFPLDTWSEPARRFVHSLLSLVVMLLALCAGGCASEPSVGLVQWSLRAEGGTVQTVALPTHVDHLLAPSPQTFVLETSIDLPEAFRGRDLALVIPHLWAPVVLTVNGHRAESLAREAHVVYRVCLPRGMAVCSRSRRPPDVG